MYAQRAEKQLPLKYLTTRNLYKGSNVTFNPVTFEALSYDWWIFVKRIKGKVVFNDYYYSSTTRKHQRKVENLFSNLGIRINCYIEAPMGLQNLDRAIFHYEQKIKTLQGQIEKPRSHKTKNASRKAMLKVFKAHISMIKELKE